MQNHSICQISWYNFLTINENSFNINEKLIKYKRLLEVLLIPLRLTTAASAADAGIHNSLLNLGILY